MQPVQYVKRHMYACFQSWPLGTGQPTAVLIPEEDRTSYSQLSLDAYSSLCRVKASWIFPVPF